MAAAIDLDEGSPRTASQLLAWCRGWHRRLRNQSFTLEVAGEEVRGRLSRAKGPERMAAAIKARRVSVRIKFAAMLVDAAASQVAKAEATFLREFGEYIPGVGGGRSRRSGPFKLDA